MGESKRVRKPAVAGSFYPKNPQVLRRDIEAFLSRVPKPSRGGRPLVLIEPHAGYMYSGQVAAYGYRLIEDRDVRTVAVVSPSHIEYFPFASVFDGDAYETPLGRIDVDGDTARVLASSAPDWIKLSDRGHSHTGSYRQEHALEVQLPFLQTVLEDFRIVPIVMGDQEWELCSVLGEALSSHMAREDFLVVVSSDLSHFHGHETARRMDSTFCDLMEGMNPLRLFESVRRSECEACGSGPVIASLIAGRRVGAVSCRILHTATSGDVSGDHDSVVGYAAAVIRSGGDEESEIEKEDTEDARLAPAEKSHLLELARHSVETAVGVPGHAPPDMASEALLAPRGLFVTLKIAGRLRGCIGLVEAEKPLKTTVAEMARAAALSDPRFPPVAPGELPELDVEISVLSPLHRVETIDEIVVGKHGLVVERGLNRGLLLPQVATEQGWDAETFLGYACEKAGLPRNAWRESDTRIFAFSALVFGDKRKGSKPRAAKS